MEKQYRDDDFLVVYDPEEGIKTIYCNRTTNMFA